MAEADIRLLAGQTARPRTVPDYTWAVKSPEVTQDWRTIAITLKNPLT